MPKELKRNWNRSHVHLAIVQEKTISRTKFAYFRKGFVPLKAETSSVKEKKKETEGRGKRVDSKGNLYTRDSANDRQRAV